MHASFWKRLAASCVDVIIVIAIFYLVMATAILLSYGIQMLIFQVMRALGSITFIFYLTKWTGMLRILTVVVSPIWLYYALMESSKVQGTVGKKVLGIVVVNEEMKQPSFGQVSVRFWSRIVTVLTLGVGYIMAAFTNNKQTIHDRISHTHVVDKNVMMKQLEAAQMGALYMRGSSLSPQPEPASPSITLRKY